MFMSLRTLADAQEFLNEASHSEYLPLNFKTVLERLIELNVVIETTFAENAISDEVWDKYVTIRFPELPDPRTIAWIANKSGSFTNFYMYETANDEYNLTVEWNNK